MHKCCYSHFWFVYVMNDQSMNWGDFVRVHFRYFVQTEDAGEKHQYHYRDVMMDTMASQITSLTIVFSTVYAGADQKNIKTPRHWPCEGKWPVTGELPAQRATNAENVSIWWRHHDVIENAVLRDMISLLGLCRQLMLSPWLLIRT